MGIGLEATAARLFPRSTVPSVVCPKPGAWSPEPVIKSSMDLEQLRYPVGRFTEAVPLTAAGRSAAIAQLAALPAQVRSAVDGLADAQLDTPYRPDGWTVRQVVHHLADSHMNAFIRIKLASPRRTRSSSPTTRTRGPTLPDAGCRSTARSPSWKACTSAGPRPARPQRGTVGSHLRASRTGKV